MPHGPPNTIIDSRCCAKIISSRSEYSGAGSFMPFAGLFKPHTSAAVVRVYPYSGAFSCAPACFYKALRRPSLIRRRCCCLWGGSLVPLSSGPFSAFFPAFSIFRV